MTLTELQLKIDDWINKYGVRYFNELTNLGILVEEVGELSRYMVRIYGEQSFKDKSEEINAHQKMKEELGDVFFVLACIANQCNINLEEVMDENIQKKTKRDMDRHINNPKL